MRKKLPPLNALRTFEAAARNGSLKHAANELCVSHSAVSHQIKQLERHLGVELFARKARSVELSKRGREYYPVPRAAFDKIAEGAERTFTPDSLSSYFRDATFALAGTGVSCTGMKVPSWKNSQNFVPGCCRKSRRTTQFVQTPTKTTLRLSNCTH
jgi:hypothetical protein